MKRIAMTTERTNAETVICDDFLEIRQSRGLVEHGELAMGISNVVSGCQFTGVDLEPRQPLENRIQRKLRKQRCENPNAHKILLLEKFRSFYRSPVMVPLL